MWPRKRRSDAAFRVSTRNNLNVDYAKLDKSYLGEQTSTL